jgi:ABC-type taurine transport system ATPase subunit
MSNLDYWLGQMQQTLQSVRSEQTEHGAKIEQLTKKVDEALTWAQRLVLLGMTIIGALVLNYSPDRIGEAVASVLRSLR